MRESRSWGVHRSLSGIVCRGPAFRAAVVMTLLTLAGCSGSSGPGAGPDAAGAGDGGPSDAADAATSSHDASVAPDGAAADGSVGERDASDAAVSPSDAQSVDGGERDASDAAVSPSDAQPVDGGERDGADATVEGGAGNDAGNVGDIDAAGNSLCAACGAGLVACDGRCWSGTTCPSTCVASACGTDPHTQYGCNAAGECTIVACNPGFADCNATVSDGCEIDLSLPSNCGACGNVCSGTNYLCGAGGCEATCGAGETYCATGICANLTTSPEHCGACSVACAPIPNGGAGSCVGGTCRAAACPAGTTDCDGGCTDTTADPMNCGACGHACTPAATQTAATCSGSTCVFACPPSESVCSDRCVALGVDPANCGACGRACASGEICALPGTCVAPSALVLTTVAGAPTDLAADADRLYWVDLTNYTVNSMPKGGGAVTTLANDQYEITATPPLALDDTYAYWVAHGTLRTRKDGTGPVETVTSTALGSLAPAAGNLYYETADPNGITVDISYIAADGGAGGVFYNAQFSHSVLDPDLVSSGSGLYVSAGFSGPTGILSFALDGGYTMPVEYYGGASPVQFASGPAGLYIAATTQEWALPGPFGLVTAADFEWHGDAGELRNATIANPSGPWSPMGCGVVSDVPDGGLQVTQGVPNPNSVIPNDPNASTAPWVAVLDASALAALGDVTSLVYGNDGYVYFIDGHKDIGRVPVR